MHSRTLLAAVLTCAFGNGLTACDAARHAPDEKRGDLLTSSQGVLRDASNREVILRGVNARIDGIFDVTFDDGREALEVIPPFIEEDCRFLGEDMGMNHLRLPVNWSAVEPEKGAYDSAYVARILEVAEFCERHGVYTLVDLHQDAWSKHIGEDGAPLWAIVPEPEELLEGPLHDLEARRLSGQVLAAFESFWENEEGLQDAYAVMAAWLAGQINGRPGVIGLEIMNEPVVFGREERLDAFHERVAAAVRSAVPDMSLFFEPNSLRNITDLAPVRTPVSFNDAVYAPHIYTDVFETGWESEDKNAVRASVKAARREADEHAAALYIGEFGNGPTERGLLYTRTALDLFDAFKASSAFWVYEEWSQGSWGLYQPETGPTEARGGLREDMAAALARAYPAAIAGDIESFTFAETERTLQVAVENAHTGVDHVLAAPTRLYPEGLTVRCDGTETAHSYEKGRVRFRCAGSLILLAPAVP